ncbi:MLO-like protein 13 [Primulina tabacum]|uniref:MLO-like protein 13 n=1 Tax=Primulina tabacum TaxID=48773 RepID=UPI003F5AD882
MHTYLFPCAGTLSQPPKLRFSQVHDEDIGTRFQENNRNKSFNSWYVWLFVVIFLLLNIAGYHLYFWISFSPLALLLIVGAKLEHIITELATDAAQRADESEGTRVRPSDELFWFPRPALVLYLIHFILFQNSFEIAFLFWIWVITVFSSLSTYGFRSCIMEELGFIITRIVVGSRIKTPYI